MFVLFSIQIISLRLWFAKWMRSGTRHPRRRLSWKGRVVNIGLRTAYNIWIFSEENPLDSWPQETTDVSIENNENEENDDATQWIK